MSQWAKQTGAFLGSIRLAIALLIILTVVSFFGIIIPQGLPAAQYYHKWGETWAKGFLFFGIDHIFSTAWFYLLLGLVSCNIIVCSVSRLWKNTRNSLKASHLFSKRIVELCRHTTAFSSNRQTAAARDAAIKQLKRQHYTVSMQDQDGGYLIAARKGILKDIGSLVFHVSIVMLFIGGMIGSQYGYSGIRSLRGGQIISIPDRAFLLRCEWFEFEQNEDGSPKDYRSKLSILSPKDSSVILDKVINVNSPLSHQGIRFYQSSYGLDAQAIKNVSIQVSGPGLPHSGFNGVVAYGQPVPLANSGIEIRVYDFLPDFIIDLESRTAATRSDQHNNPAVRIALTRGADTLFDHWTFFKFPEQHSAGGQYRAIVDSYEPSYYTGIQVRKNPGVPIIWVGIILMTFGICAVFYIPKKRLWIAIEPGAHGGASAITLGGSSNRAPMDFQDEFDRFGAQLKNTLNQDA